MSESLYPLHASLPVEQLRVGPQRAIVAPLLLMPAVAVAVVRWCAWLVGEPAPVSALWISAVIGVFAGVGISAVAIQVVAEQVSKP